MRLYDRMEEAAARRHFSRHTINCYCRWAGQFLVFCRDGERWRHPAELSNRPAVAVARPVHRPEWVKRRFACRGGNQGPWAAGAGRRVGGGAS